MFCILSTIFFSCRLFCIEKSLFCNSGNKFTLYDVFQSEESQIAIFSNTVNIHAFVKPILDAVECWHVFIEHHATN